MDFKFCIFYFVIFFGCSERSNNQEKIVTDLGHDVHSINSEKRFVSRDSLLIDSLGIGNYGVCDQITDSKYRGVSFKIDTMTFEDGVWLGYYFLLDSLGKRWILLETRDVESFKLSKLTTNSVKYYTNEGLSVGMPLQSIVEKKLDYEIRLEESEVFIFMKKSNAYLSFGKILKVDFDVFEANYHSVEKKDLLKMLNQMSKVEKITILSYCN
jgi:hypothetical protein